MSKIKKLLASFVVLLIMMLFFVNSAFAADLFNGQDHTYKVIFRGNGDAVVYAKIAMTNTENTDLQTFIFEIPSVDVSDLSIFQQFLPSQVCAAFSDLADGTRKCLRYKSLDYYDDFSWRSVGAKVEYKKAQYTARRCL